MAIINPPSHFFTREKAETLCEHFNNDPDEDWTYTPVHPPSGKGWSKIAIYDEDGIFIAHL